jgi:hypothetical protein
MSTNNLPPHRLATAVGPECRVTSTLHWFETELLTREENLIGLMAVNRDLIGQAETFDQIDCVVLDMDSSESPVHGQQEGSAWLLLAESHPTRRLFGSMLQRIWGLPVPTG